MDLDPKKEKKHFKDEELRELNDLDENETSKALIDEEEALTTTPVTRLCVIIGSTIVALTIIAIGIVLGVTLGRK